MKFKQLIASIGLGLGLGLIFLAGMVRADDPDHHKNHRLSSATPPPLGAANDESIQETDLTSGGSIFEVNPDDQGNLWLSEAGADRIWQFNRSTSAYTIYNGLRDAADARRDNNNNVWWTGYSDGLLGRINLTANTVTTWTLPGVDNPWGVAFDTAGQIWVTVNAAPHIYRFDPTSTQLCSYTVPDSGESDYIVHDAGNLWIGDYNNGRLVKFNSATNQFTYWQLPFNSYPEGLAVDSSGNLWWAENQSSALGRLEPTANRVTTYALPTGGEANMIAISGQAVWYTGGTSGTFGVMNPNTAVGSSATIAPATVAATPSCVILGAGVTSTPVISTGAAVFTAGVITPIVNSGGWTVYQLSLDSSLWGIANAGGVWLGDQGRDKLVRFFHLTYLPIVLN